MKKFLTMLVASSAMILSACSNQVAYTQNHSNIKLAYNENQPFFLFGIGQERSVDAVQICGDEKNIAKVESQLTAGNILVGLVTIGIYTPRASRVYCQQ